MESLEVFGLITVGILANEIYKYLRVLSGETATKWVLIVKTFIYLVGIVFAISFALSFIVHGLQAQTISSIVGTLVVALWFYFATKANLAKKE